MCVTVCCNYLVLALIGAIELAQLMLITGLEHGSHASLGIDVCSTVLTPVSPMFCLFGSGDFPVSPAFNVASLAQSTPFTGRGVLEQFGNHQSTML